LTPDGERREETLTDYAYQRQFGVGPALPDYFVTAQNLVPGDHMVLQGTIWKFIDSSISKTIDVLEDNSFDAFAAVFTQAYDMSCKGCTTYFQTTSPGLLCALWRRRLRPPEPA
jgi:ribonucleoside-diphosphate reductase alpha chain